MSCNINELFKLLSQSSSAEQQKLGIEMANKIEFLSVLIMPVEDKSVWENCAKVLAGKSDDELRIYISRLFEWLMGMNWPGADIIYERLLNVPAEMLIPEYEFSLERARQTEDHSWEMSLKYFYNEYENRHRNGFSVC